MSSDTKAPESAVFERATYKYGAQARCDRQRDLKEKALNALWDGAAGNHSGVIVQLRHRGNEAARRANRILWSLAAVIFLGLAFYLGQPFARLWVDGERIALSRQLENTKTATKELRLEMDKQRQGYEDALADSLDTIFTPTKAAFLGHAKIAGGLLFYGEDGTLYRTTPDGTQTGTLLETPNDVVLFGHAKIAGGLLFYGEDGTLFRTTPDGTQTGELLETPNKHTLLGHAKIAGGLLFYGTGGTLFRTTPDGTQTGKLLETPNKHALFGHTEIEGGLLLYGADGTLFRTEPDGTITSPLLDTPNDADIYGHAKIDDGLLFYGAGGTLFRTEPNGAKAGALLDTPDISNILGHTDVDDGLLFYGGGLQHFNILLGQSTSFEELVGTRDYSWDSLDPLKEEIWVLATSLNLEVDRLSPLNRLFPSTVMFRTAPDGTQAGESLETPNDPGIFGHAVIDGGLLFFGGHGTFWRGLDFVHNRFSAQSESALSIYPKSEAAETMDNLGYVSATLAVMAEFRQELMNEQPKFVARTAEFTLVEESLKTQAINLREDHDRAFDRLAQFRQFPFSLIWERQANAFQDFMATCRGKQNDADGSISKACVEGWQAQLNADRQNWWQTLAVQVPPGVLLLFLLATLGALYRYSLRMAGFYHSRADALELVQSGLDTYTQTALTALATDLAADKVVFGKDRTPLEQAVDAIKAARG
ncbi:MAG: hypothetical protein ABJD13_08270 [Paracoccaceae bacterium]